MGLDDGGDVAEAERLRLYLLEHENDVRARLMLGDIYCRLRDHDRALSSYERVAEIYIGEGTLIKAVAVFKQIHSLIERHAPNLAGRYAHTEHRLAGVFEQLGLRDDAVATWRAVAKRYVDAGDEASATAVITRILSLEPNTTSARLMLATLQARAGNNDAALVTLEQVVTLALSHGRTDDAIRALRGALTLRENVDHARLLAELLLERGGKSDALEALAKLQLCYRDNPKSIPTLRFLVRAFDRVGEPEKANAVLKESARIVFESGARDTFNRIVNALLERAPDDPEVAELDAMHEPVLLSTASVVIEPPPSR